jgi:hypothetical protein
MQAGRLRGHERESDPEHRAEDRQREPEVRRQPELRHARIVDEAALDHVPAHRALQRAQREDRGELPRVFARDQASRGEPDERDQEDDADRSAQQPVEVFPPEDALELGEAHSRVHLPVFGRLLILGERLLPLRGVERRQRPHDRLPFDDREAGMREPRDTADDDHREHQRAADEKPCGDPAMRRARSR